MEIVKGENYDKWGFDSRVDEIEELLSYTTPRFLGTKDGLTLYHIKGESWNQFIYLQRNRDKKVIGMLAMAKTPYRHIGYGVRAVYISSRYRGKGLGTVMYLGAVHVLKKIHSSTCIGEMAVRTWRSLSKYHTLEMYDLYERKRDFKWKKRESVPRIDKKRIDETRDCYHFVIKHA
jgi:GNAT superfamily N-acetyltransferase